MLTSACGTPFRRRSRTPWRHLCAASSGTFRFQGALKIENGMKTVLSAENRLFDNEIDVQSTRANTPTFSYYWNKSSLTIYVDGSIRDRYSSYTRGGICVNSVMQINAHYRTKYYKTRGLWQAIACHEYGHTLCLDHNTSSSPSIMRRVTKQYYIDGAPKWTTPKSADIVPINLKD